MDGRDYSGSMYPPQEPVQDMTNMTYMAPPSQFGFANMYMDMSGYTAPAGHYPPYPMAMYSPTMDPMAHQQPHPQHPKKRMTFNKNANFKPNAYNSYMPVNVNVSNASTASSKSSEKGLEYRFEVGKSTYFDKDALKETYPIYINTTVEEFSIARSKRKELMKASIKDGSSSNVSEKAEESPLEANETPTVVERPKGKLSQNALPAKSVEKTEQPVQKDEIAAVAQNDETPARSSSASPSSTQDVKFPTPTGTTAALPAKSWSKLAAGSLGKSKTQQFVAPGLNIKKEKKYTPPTVKSLEPLGSVSLRVCFDKEFTAHSLQYSKGKKLISELIPRGIYNKGSICFISSVLQLLIHCQSFVNLLNVIQMTSLRKVDSTTSPLLDACMNVFSNFDKNTVEQQLQEAKENSKAKTDSSNLNENISSINPEQFYSSISKLPKFKDLTWGRQEDAEEFLTHLLDQLHEEFITSINTLSSNDILNVFQSLQDEDQRVYFLKYIMKYKNAGFFEKPDKALEVLIEKYKQCKSSSDEDENEWKEVSKKGKKAKNASKRITEVETSPISSIFGGQFRSVLDTPQNKESQSITYDPFQTIQLDISSPEVVDLESAFKKFSEYELIELKSSSGNDVEAKKQTQIDKLPQVLLIQLKRFSFVSQSTKNELSNYNSYNGRIEKIRKAVNYRHELIVPKESISPTLASLNSSDTNFKYTLSGVIYHHGVSPSGGHYTCDVYNKGTDKWFRIDDVNVEEVRNKDDVLRNCDDASESKNAYILLYEKAF